MPHEEWRQSLTTSIPRFFNTLSGRCTLVLSECVVECSKTILSSQSPVLEEYFMRSERDINALIAERRRRFLAGEGVECPGETDEEDDEEDETSVLVLTDYYGYDDIVSEFFRSFYTGDISVNSDTFRVTLKLACQYEVSWVISECCTFLETFLTEANFIDNFKFLMALKEERITAKVISKLSSFDHSKLMNHSNIDHQWFDVDIDLLVVLMDNLQPPSEIYVSHLAFSWLEYNLEHRKSKFETIISNLRLVNLPQSFINEVILKFSDVHKVDSTNLYRMVLGTQSFFFSRQMGGAPRQKNLERFPKIFQSRDSYVEMEEFEFRISLQELREKRVVTDSVSLVYNEETGEYRLAFCHRCCFVYFTDELIISANPISKIVIPIEKTTVSDDGRLFVSKEISILKDLLNRSEEDVKINFVNLVAVFLLDDD
ncbi:hypothetical protein ACHWQZ_G003470 [Mnemiopsis leidyi]